MERPPGLVRQARSVAFGLLVHSLPPTLPVPVSCARVCAPWPGSSWHCGQSNPQAPAQDAFSHAKTRPRLSARLVRPEASFVVFRSRGCSGPDLVFDIGGPRFAQLPWSASPIAWTCTSLWKGGNATNSRGAPDGTYFLSMKAPIPLHLNRADARGRSHQRRPQGSSQVARRHARRLGQLGP